MRSRPAKTRLGEVIRSQRETEELLAARRRAEAAASELHKRRSQQTDSNLELKSLTDKAQRSEQRLYSGTIKNPKELEDLQHELESLSRRQATVEDELIEAMIMVEDAGEDEAAAQASLLEIQSSWDQDQADLKQEQSDLIARINDATLQRKKQVEVVSGESLQAYEGAQRRAGTTAVVLDEE